MVSQHCQHTASRALRHWLGRPRHWSVVGRTTRLHHLRSHRDSSIARQSYGGHGHPTHIAAAAMAGAPGPHAHTTNGSVAVASPTTIVAIAATVACPRTASAAIAAYSLWCASSACGLYAVLWARLQRRPRHTHHYVMYIVLFPKRRHEPSQNEAIKWHEKIGETAEHEGIVLIDDASDAGMCM